MHPPSTDMNAISFTDQTREWVRSLEARERSKTGLPLSTARERVAAKIGASPGTLENLRRGRLKNVAAHFYERVRRLLIAELQAEAAAHEHEIRTLMAAGADLDQHQVAEAVAGLRQIKAALTREVRRG